MNKKDLDVFSAWVPFELEKSEHTEGEYVQGEPRFNPQRIKIMGIASTEAPDEAGEIIIQDGIDWSYFLKRGFLNLEHKQGPEFVMGQPEAVKACEYKGYKATMLKGYLYAEKPAVKSLVETMEAMKKAGADREIGLSVEGQVIERDKRNPTIITKSKVMNVSITSSPCNKDATMTIIKSIMNKMDKDSEFGDKEMTHRQIKIIKDYAEELCELMEKLPPSVDLQEWVQSKITRALDYLQASFHYMDVEFKMYDDEEAEKAWYDKETTNIYKEDDHKIYDMLEMLLERYPELKEKEVMDKLHDMLEMDKAYDRMEDMDPDDALDYMDNQIESEGREIVMPDFAAIQDAVVDSQLRDQDVDDLDGDDEDIKMNTQVGYQTSLSGEGSVGMIVPQSFENPISTKDYELSEVDMKRVLGLLMRKWPGQSTKEYVLLYHKIPAELRYLLARK